MPFIDKIALQILKYERKIDDIHIKLSNDDFLAFGASQKCLRILSLCALSIYRLAKVRYNLVEKTVVMQISTIFPVHSKWIYKSLRE